MKLRQGDKSNFHTLERAMEAGRACLMDARRKSDGKSVALICALNQSEGQYEFVPLAVMIEGNPYELFEPPNPDGGYESGGL